MASAVRKEAPRDQNLEWIPLPKLESDARIQRALNLNWCEARKDALDLALLGTFVVWRTGRQNILIDGMHRKKLMELAGWGDYAVPCMVLTGKTLAEASRAFNGLNDHRRVDYLTLFKNRVNYGDPAAVAIAEIAAELGLRVAGGPAPTHIQAARSLDRIYRYGGGTHARALRLALGTAKAAWNLAPDSFHGAIVEGIGLVAIRYGVRVDQDELVPKLAKNGSPGKLVGQGKTWREAHGGSLANGVAGSVVAIYNRGRRVGKVEDWRS